jgi:hypothetical protein
MPGRSHASIQLSTARVSPLIDTSSSAQRNTSSDRGASRPRGRGARRTSTSTSNVRTHVRRYARPWRRRTRGVGMSAEPRTTYILRMAGWHTRRSVDLGRWKPLPKSVSASLAPPPDGWAHGTQGLFTRKLPNNNSGSLPTADPRAHQKSTCFLYTCSLPALQSTLPRSVLRHGKPASCLSLETACASNPAFSRCEPYPRPGRCIRGSPGCTARAPCGCDPTRRNASRGTGRTIRRSRPRSPAARSPGACTHPP